MASIEPTYGSYYEVVQQITAAPSSARLPRFKENPAIVGMYEHVTVGFGREYLALLRPFLGEETICRYCKMNDVVGGGAKYEYETRWVTSPSNFRYLYHAHLILTHLRSCNAVAEGDWTTQEIVEVGCGYGGLTIALCELAPLYRVRISAYHLIDLPASSELQRRYHDQVQQYYPFGADTVFTYHSAFDYGKDLSDKRDLFLVSNYCFSEISAEHQAEYRAHLIKRPIVAHGFMAWNHIPLYDFGYGDAIRSEREVPLTGDKNYYVYF